jgi:hypothetical protein
MRPSPEGRRIAGGAVANLPDLWKASIGAAFREVRRAAHRMDDCSIVDFVRIAT